MNAKQTLYVESRRSGMHQAGAARAAGISRGYASRLEARPAVVAAIGREPRPASPAVQQEFYETAESYLRAVVSGREVPDPARIAAARAVLPFEARRQRQPLKAVRTTGEQDGYDKSAAQKTLADDWSEKVRRITREHKNGR
jgi:hypothetical protein